MLASSTSPDSMPSLILSSWVVQLLFLPHLGVDGAPYHSYHARNRQNQNNGRSARHGPPLPLPPRPLMRMDEDVDSSPSYFERHGLVPPPRTSRRRAEIKSEVIESEVSPTGSVSVSFADQRNADAEMPNEIDSIVRNAKRGLDANTRLRNDLLWGNFLEDETYYDKHSYPWEYVWYNQTNNATANDDGSSANVNDTLTGVPVEMNINFHRVFDVDIVNSVMDLVVWFRLVWVDPRLTWDPDDYDGLDLTWFWIGDGGAGGETSEIWTPDVELWNLETGLRGSLEDTYARVSSDGLVWWGRPGRLRPNCKFGGLSFFPFDKLTCTMEFGSWMHKGKYLWMEKHKGKGFSMGGSETAGESYEEYSFADDDPIKVYQHVYSMVSAPEDAWPVLMYNVTVARSWQPYARGYITIQVMLNFVGFSAFWLPPSCGERMSLSVTAMLAALASEIVVAANLPAAAELTWFSKFSILSMVFAFVSLLECVVVLYFYYMRSEDIVPSWYTFTKNWYLVRQARKSGEEVKKCAGEIAERTTMFLAETAVPDPLTFDNKSEGKRSHVKASVQKNTSYDEAVEDARSESQYDDNVTQAHDSPVFNRRSENLASSKEKPKEQLRHQNISTRASMLSKYDSQMRNSAMMPRDADDFVHEGELENNMKWKYVAARIDDFARFWIPLAFVVSLAIVLAEVL